MTRGWKLTASQSSWCSSTYKVDCIAVEIYIQGTMDAKFQVIPRNSKWHHFMGGTLGNQKSEQVFSIKKKYSKNTSGKNINHGKGVKRSNILKTIFLSNKLFQIFLCFGVFMKKSVTVWFFYLYTVCKCCRTVLCIFGSYFYVAILNLFESLGFP